MARLADFGYPFLKVVYSGREGHVGSHDFFVAVSSYTILHVEYHVNVNLCTVTANHVVTL